mgnify:CR=1 FL=1
MDSGLLKSEEIANFITDGYLRYDSIIPKDLCDEIITQIDDGYYSNYNNVGEMFKVIYSNASLGKIFKIGKVENIIESLLGKTARYDHHYIHRKYKFTNELPNLHQDGEIDKRNYQFDLLILFFPHDVSLNMGGTLIIPSSHFRKVSGNIIKRYHNIINQEIITCKAGTLYFVHHNLWHAARSNLSNKDRIMIKFRLNPSDNQKLNWDYKNTNLQNVMNILSKNYVWHGDQQRIENINRIKLWRYLYDDNTSELENKLLWGTNMNDIKKVIYQDSVRSLDKNDS